MKNQQITPEQRASLLTGNRELLGHHTDWRWNVLGALIVALTFWGFSGSCKTTPTTPDSFYDVVVTCTVDNVKNPQAGAAVLACLTGAVGGDYSACLAGLVTAGTWTVEEVACIVRAYATSSAQKLNAGTALPADQTVLTNANAWIRAHKVVYR